MRHLRKIYWLFWVGLPTLTAYPVSTPYLTDLHNDQGSLQWERYWIRYTITLLSLTVAAFTLAGCLCCRRPRRTIGFQDKAGKCKQEFKNGSSTGPELPFEQSIEGLAIDVPRMIALTDRVQFEPLPVDRIISGPKVPSPTKPSSISHLSFTGEYNEDNATLQEPCREWFEAEDLYVPREKLKYLRELGRGWFGKVVEGRADLDQSKGALKNGGVVVRILAEEATMKEKAWFLGEATPYLKLHHQNVLALLGFCLETDPYLLLFESCPAGDLKGFLLSNHDKKSQEALIKENIPTRMALEIAAGLQHMHNHGFAHTDLSARNCLVASDLSAKLGDYGTGVEKYPEDYYIVGDRALPIRWSAPESLDCTDTTIETRQITLQANVWSYAVLLWEIINWGNRPYDNMCDEEVIQMLLSLKTDFSLNNIQPLHNCPENSPSNILHVICTCLNTDAKKRPSLNDIRQNLLTEHIEQEDFEQWENLQTNTLINHTRSASLQNLRGSVDSDHWTSIMDEKPLETLQSSFRLGPDEPIKSVMNMESLFNTAQESGSETEEESWRGRIERGVYTEKVKQKSKSVTDLMILVHIDPESDGELSMGTQMTEKTLKKRLSTTGSDSDLTRTMIVDEFDEVLRKLRNPIQSDVSNKTKSINNSEKPKLLTLTMDQEQTPILRLSLDSKENSIVSKNSSVLNTSADSIRSEEHILRLLSKGDPDLPLLRYVPDSKPSCEILESTNETQSDNISTNNENNESCFSNNFSFQNLDTNQNNLVDVLLWNHALDSALEHKIPGFSDEGEFKEFIEPSINQQNNTTLELSTSANVTENSEQFDKENSVYNLNDLSNTEDMGIVRKVLINEYEERKHLSTPDDEQSSDSGFRDKESCEEEESMCPPCDQTSSHDTSIIHVPTCTEDEQLQVLLELDTILDAEYYSILPESDNSVGMNNTNSKAEYDNPNIQDIKSQNTVSILSNEITTNTYIEQDEEVNTQYLNKNDRMEDEDIKPTSNMQNGDFVASSSSNYYDDTNNYITENSKESKISSFDAKITHADTENYIQDDTGHENEEEDSSTMSLCSDNSYVSFGMEEEFVTAIRNELREKLPRAQMPVVEPSEPRDEEISPISSDIENKRWDDDENEESPDRSTSSVDISIRYNLYGTPLSPILEERESTVTSESLLSNSRDASIVSKESVPSEDVLLVDTRTNKMILLEGSREKQLQDDDRDTTNGDISEEENVEYSSSSIYTSEDKPHAMIATGGAPLPSPEEETKWQQLPSSFPLPLPLPLQDDLMSTSFATERDWDSQDDDEVGDEEGEDEDNSSSSGEFVWKRYSEPHAEQIQIRSTLSNEKVEVEQADLREEIDAEDEEEEEFTPSAWNATLAPHRSALRSPDKTLKSGDQKKSVWFKKQRYHCVYEYPKETLANDIQGQATTTWEPTSYTDWEELMNEPRLDMYPLDYEDINRAGNEEFYVSSSNRPFQFPTSDSKYVSQFFPGACSTSVNEEEQDEVDCNQEEENTNSQTNEHEHIKQYQLGELRHTRDRLKLNLLAGNNAVDTTFVPLRQVYEDKEDLLRTEKTHTLDLLENMKVTEDQCNLSNLVDDNTSPKVPQEDFKCEIDNDPVSPKIYQNDNEKKIESANNVAF
uniref:rho-associated protein kinase 1-like isoform X2 n=1 Tax=Vespula vulgaris TaxID=7454 RepID=UPI0021224DB5|nr:rho-associated protein kinase 1-like isoform X2 [Vespula vulgaris]